MTKTPTTLLVKRRLDPATTISFLVPAKTEGSRSGYSTVLDEEVVGARGDVVGDFAPEFPEFIDAGQPLVSSPSRKRTVRR